MVERLRWGVLSTARIGVDKVIPALQRSERGAVVAIASRDGSRAEKAASGLGIARAHASYEALLDDPDVNAIYNPLPNHLHAEWTLAAARVGKHVLCEKPLGLDADEAQHMIDGCRDAGVTLVEGFMYRQHPQWVRTREIVASGRLGMVQAIQTFFSYDNRNPADIRNIAEFGGGALMDIGCYCIDLSRMLFGGEPQRVEGMLRVDPDFGTDVLSSALLSFSDGRHATFTCSTQCTPDQRVHVVGTDARLTVEIPFNAPPDRPLRLLLAAEGPQEPPEVIEVSAADQYSLQGDAFARSVLDGEAVPLEPENGVANLRIIAALRGAAA